MIMMEKDTLHNYDLHFHCLIVGNNKNSYSSSLLRFIANGYNDSKIQQPAMNRFEYQYTVLLLKGMTIPS